MEEREERKLCERMMHHVGKIYTGYVKNTTHKQQGQVENPL